MVQERRFQPSPRRLPRWSEFRELLQFRRPSLSRSQRIERAMTIADLRRLARRRAPRAVFDYTDGAAEAEISLRRSRAVYQRVEFSPRVLRDVSEVDTSATILGKQSSLPLALSPTGFTRMMHTQGEKAVATAAVEMGIPYALSTLGTTSIDDLASAVPGGEKWFQLYVWKDRGFAKELIDRAQAHGYTALVLTVDTPVAGIRLRDEYNGLTIPPRLTLKTLLDGALHPSWWMDFISTEPLTFATLSDTGGTVADLIDRVFDPSVDFDDVSWLKENWDGPVIIKGIQSIDDARESVRRGADAVIISNHGGRQLDRSPTTLELVRPITEAIGEEAEVFVDGGITNGADIAAAVALGARAAMVGRAYLYGLMAGGYQGVARALEILATEYTRTLRLLGVRSTTELEPGMVRLRT